MKEEIYNLIEKRFDKIDDRLIDIDKRYICGYLRCSSSRHFIY